MIVDPCANGIETYREGHQNRGLAMVDEELAQLDLRRAYKANCLGARKALG